LARLQQVLVALALLAASAWAFLVWPWGMAWVLVGLAVVLGGHAVVLALECVLAARVNRADPAPMASWQQWWGAWWQEVRVAPVVFAWRQPFRWGTWPDDVEAGKQHSPAVVLVHGFVCNRGLWTPWMKALRLRGIPYVSVNLEPVFGSIDDYIPLIEEAVCRAERLGGRPPVLVGHSMGGLAARIWLATQENRRRVARVMTIGTPHRGTWLARFSSVANGRQMRTAGEWLKALEARERESEEAPYARFICWYSNTDNIVFPASTATLPGADNRLVEGAAHVAMAFDPALMQAAMAEIEAVA
jgi:triacylglycerol lipase